MLPGRTFQDVAVAEPHHGTCADAKGRSNRRGGSIGHGTEPRGTGREGGEDMEDMEDPMDTGGKHSIEVHLGRHT